MSHISRHESGVASIFASETTREAAEGINVSGQLRRVLSAVSAGGGDGVTGPEIHQEVGLSVSLVSTRLKTLANKDLIEKALTEDGSIKKRYGASGMRATVWITKS